MDRRTLLASLTGGLASLWVGDALAQAPHDAGPTLVAAWRSASELSPLGALRPAAAAADYVGLIEPDWEAKEVRVRQAIAVPGRVHGLAACRQGGYVAVAYRPGQWLLRVDAEGRVAQRLDMAAEPGQRSLDGHAVFSPDGQWLITTETGPRLGEGWVSLRDPLSLHKRAEWRTHGVEPHDARFDSVGHLLVANGGILRAPGDRKRDLDDMNSSLVRLDIGTGALLGQWRLADQRLSLRHLAVAASAGPDGTLRVGVGIQAEHDDPARRAEAPVLAVWDGQTLDIPARQAIGKGYCGDIAAGAGGSFFLNCERAHRVLRWDAARPAELQVIAELERGGALAPWRPGNADGGVLIGGQRGVARWHPANAPGMLRWPMALALDNHWAVVA
jgi:hypothetical protein